MHFNMSTYILTEISKQLSKEQPRCASAKKISVSNVDKIRRMYFLWSVSFPPRSERAAEVGERGGECISCGPFLPHLGLNEPLRLLQLRPAIGWH